MKIKVFIVIDHLGTGGAQQQVLEYLKFAAHENYEFKVINLDAIYEPLADQVRALGVDVVSIAHKGFFNPATLRILTRLFKQEQPDIVHTYLFTADCYGRLAAKLAGTKVIICSIRSTDLWKKPHHIMVDRILAKYTDKILINADGMKNFLMDTEKIDSGKILRIYNGVDLKKFEPAHNVSELRKELRLPNNMLIVGMIGRFSNQKDYKTYLNVAEEVLNERNDICFLAVGDGPLRAEFEDRYSKVGEGKIIFTGLRKDIPNLIQLMDIGVLATHYEGCPNVILEYMASSKPVVASDVDGCPELVLDGKTGFIVPPSDPKALKQKILSLIEDGDLRFQMGAAGRRQVEEQFDSKRLAQNIEKLYDDLLKPRIAFLLSQFPETHETFILREFNALKDKGMAFDIFSLKPCRDKIVHPEAKDLMARTFYYPVWAGVWAFFYWLIKRPLRLTGLYVQCVLPHYRHPFQMVKAKVVFFRSLHFARVMHRCHVRHVHAHWATMPTTGAEVIAGLLNVDFSFTAHAWDIYLNDKDVLKKKMDRARFALTCTQAGKTYLDNLNPGQSDDRVIVNYHGLDLKSFVQRDEREGASCLILAIGRLVEQKGFKYLIEACGILKRQAVDFQCVIVGEGPLRNDFERLIDNLGLKGVVKLPGSVPQEQIKQWFREAAVFAAPSVIAANGDRDGIPNVLLEALAIGTPVVASDVSGIPEVIIDRRTGLLISSRDEVALAEALGDILLKKVDVGTFQANGRAQVEKDFDIRKNIDQFVGVFEKQALWGS